MANSATAQEAIDGPDGKIYPVTIVLDTTGADLTVFTPDAGNYGIMIGLMYVNALAHKLTMKSGSTTLWVAELANNSGIFTPMSSDKIGHSLTKGAALKLRVDTAALTAQILAYFVKSTHLRVGRI